VRSELVRAESMRFQSTSLRNVDRTRPDTHMRGAIQKIDCPSGMGRRTLARLKLHGYGLSTGSIERLRELLLHHHEFQLKGCQRPAVAGDLEVGRTWWVLVTGACV
jgi:hypothetical protein